MKANESRIETFLSTNKTSFAIPVYQRNYDWTRTQCKQLLDDVMTAGKTKELDAHFIGSIVYVHNDIYTVSAVNELMIIDGQQRLTTLTLLYVTLYRFAKQAGNQDVAEEINETYLINKRAPEAEKLKLKPTENNKEALKHLLSADDGEPFNGGYSKIIENFTYFKEAINQDNFDIVRTGLAKLMFVEIALDRQKDNAQRIFESLNSTGLALSQGDLIRNYILMGLEGSEQENFYRNYWEKIEFNAKDEHTHESKVSEFIRDFLTLKHKKIPNKNNVYQQFKERYPTTSKNALEPLLNEIKSLSRVYNKLLNPNNETDNEIREQLKYIKKIEINVAFPFLMQVYADHTNHIIDKKTFVSVLRLVQSFTFRRFLMDIPTNGLNKIFMSLYNKVDLNSYLESIQKALLNQSFSQRFPKDTEVISALKKKDIYNMSHKNRAYLFERLENFQNSERVEIEGNHNITIEHIFPQTPAQQWKEDLGEADYSLIETNYLHTIGNLTLSGNNGSLGNQSFAAKKTMDKDGGEQGYVFSRLWLNRDLQSKEKWGSAEIEERAQRIAERFIHIWDFPNIALNTDTSSYAINIFNAQDPTYKKLDYAVFLDQKLDVRDVTALYIEVFKKLFARDSERFFTTDLGKRIELSSIKEQQRLRAPVAIDSNYAIEKNKSNLSKFEDIKYALEIFELDDELEIKYAD